MRSRLVLGAVLALVCNPCSSQSIPTVRGPDIVVTASRTPQLADDVLHSVTVIGAEEIALGGQQSLVELLQSRGGVEISRNGGHGQLASVFIRGANSGHTLVLVDGLRVSAATSGATAFEHIPIHQIERIEIVRGPASALYGSDAVGGVVHIITKGHARGSKAQGSVGAGGHGTWTATGAMDGRMGGANLAVSLGAFETRGFSATKPGIPFGQHHPDDDGYRNLSLSARVLAPLGAGRELGATLFHSEGRARFDSGAGSDDLSDQRLQTLSTHGRWRFSPAWESVLRAGIGRDSLAIRGAFPSRFRTTQPQASWQNTLSLGGGTAIAGLDYLSQRLDTDQDFVRTSRNVKAAFLGHQGMAGSHRWQLNARFDDNEQFGGHWTGSAAYGYDLAPGLQVRGSLGSAFKAPTFNDLYFPGFGNPDLAPERSRSAELGIGYRAAAWRWRLTRFESRITDLIVFDPGRSRPVNVSRARIGGTEIEVRAGGDSFSAGMAVTFQDPRNDITGHLLQRRARRHGTADVRVARGAWSLGAELVASSARFDSVTQSASTRLHGYALLNLTASYLLAPRWSARLRWNNVTNRDYELAQHFNTPGSNVFAALRYEMP